MKQKLVFATNNPHKLREIQEILGSDFQIMSLKELNITEDIPETADTLEGNALQKAQYVHERTGLDCFADDTGLMVDALSGAPGVYSARYAGENASFEDNMDKLLSEMKGQHNRKARFVTVIALILNNETHYFEGVAEGRITEEKKGNQGFGYDPVFLPDEFDQTFAQLDAETKNKISHRGRSVKKLADFLK